MMTTTSTYAPTPSPAATSTAKTQKRLRNWEAEDAAQIRRGHIDLYIAKAIFERPKRDGRRRRPQLYSDGLFFAALVLRKLERRAYRPLEGYLQALCRLMGIDAPTPDHTTLWRRMEHISVPPLKLPKGKCTVILDSTGVKTFGPGEWAIWKHRESVKRRYLKLHAARDAASGQILGWELTPPEGYGSGDVSQGTRLMKALLERGLELEAVAADGAYDSADLREFIHRAGARVLIPPPRSARLTSAKKGRRHEPEPGSETSRS